MAKMARLRAGVVTAGALLALSFVTGTAAASPQEADCDPHEGLVCLFINGVTNQRHKPVPSGSCLYTRDYYVGMINYTGYFQRKWEYSNCTGKNLLVGPGEQALSTWTGRGLGGY